MSAQDEDEFREEEEEEEKEHEEGEEEEGEEGTEEEAPPPPPEPKEELPDEKPFTGDSMMHFGGNTLVKILFTDSSLPKWLQYIVSDDEFWFQRTVAEAGIGEGEEGEGEGEAAPVESAPPDAAGEEEEGGEQEDEGKEGKTDEVPCPPFDPNMKLVLEYTSADPITYDAKVFIPPPPVDEEAAAAPEAEGGAQAALSGSNVEEEGEEEEGAQETAEEGSPTKVEEVGESDSAEVFLDVVTLAAMYSPSAFQYCMTLKEPSPLPNYSVLEDWCAHTVGSSELPEGTTIIDNIVAASKQVQDQKKVEHEKAYRAHLAEEAAANKTEGEGEEEGGEGEPAAAPPPMSLCPPHRTAFDFTWIFEKLSKDPIQYSGVCLSTIRRLLAAEFVPSKPIEPQYLRNSDAVQGYCLLLVSMPRTLVAKWTAPPLADEEEEPAPADEDEKPVYVPLSHGAGQILLDLRTRNARAKAGKPDLRKTPVEVHKKYFPAKLEKRDDKVMASPFAKRHYTPEELELHMSDLILECLALAPEAFGSASFEELYKKKIELLHQLPVSARTGLYALLFQSIHLISPTVALAIIEMSPPSVFAEKGLVDPVEWCKTMGGKIPRELCEKFAKRFFRVLHTQPEALTALELAAPHLAEAISKRNAEFDEFLSAVEQGSIATEELQSSENSLGEINICNSYVLHKAVDHNNTVVVEYLFGGKNIVSVRSCEETGAEIAAIEHALHTRNVCITSLLVHLGADLRAPWSNGTTNGLSFIEDNWRAEEAAATSTGEGGVDAFSSAEQKQREEQNAIVEDLLSLWKTREHERATDPSKQYGIRLSVLAA